PNRCLPNVPPRPRTPTPSLRMPILLVTRAREHPNRVSNRVSRPTRSGLTAGSRRPPAILTDNSNHGFRHLHGSQTGTGERRGLGPPGQADSDAPRLGTANDEMPETRGQSSRASPEVAASRELRRRSVELRARSREILEDVRAASRRSQVVLERLRTSTRRD